jgi:uncharacterized protein (DUF305 family)
MQQGVHQVEHTSCITPRRPRSSPLPLDIMDGRHEPSSSAIRMAVAVGWNEPTMPPGRGPNDMGPNGRQPDGNMPDGPLTGMPGGMTSDGDMSKLKDLSGTEFDREFLTMTTAHHQTALTMAQAGKPTAATSRPRHWPPTSSGSQTEEINLMAELLKSI